MHPDYRYRNRVTRVVLAGLLSLGLALTHGKAGADEPDATTTTVEYDRHAEWGEPAPLDTTTTSTTTTTTTPDCQEDEPCWDCETMGNGICGPAPVPAEPSFTG